MGRFETLLLLFFLSFVIVIWLNPLIKCFKLNYTSYILLPFLYSLFDAFSFKNIVQFSSFAQSCPTLQPHESQHARPPCPSPTPGVHSDSHPSSQWCHPAILSSVVPFSSCPQSLPASKSFPMSQLFAWGGQSTGVSALASFLPKKSQCWSPTEWTGWSKISVYVKIIKEICLNTDSNSLLLKVPIHLFGDEAGNSDFPIKQFEQHSTIILIPYNVA